MERERQSLRRGNRDDDSGSRRRGDDSGDDRRDRRDRDRGDADDSSRRGGGRGGGGFQYRRRDDAATRRRAETGGRTSDGFIDDKVKVFSPSDGANIIRILPPTWPDAEHYGLDVHVHYGIGADRHSYLCLHKMKGEDCPICEEREKALRNGDQEFADELRPTRRVLVYLLDREKEKEGVQAWAAPWSVDESLIKASTDRRSGGVLPIDDPEDGYDVEFDRTGKGINTKYVGMSVARRSSPLDNDEALEFIQENALPDILKFHDYDHIARAFNGGAGMGNKDKDRDSSRRDSNDRGGRDRDRRDDDRGGDRARDRSSKSSELPTWDAVHGMNYDELCALVDDTKIDVDPDKSKDDEDLADWICEELKIEKEAASSGRERLSRLRGGRS